ncbi:MAG: 23S rRNA (pseudouridine(1915)-N(3))-methyltransferase RlmH [Planctomycetes bacterium]|jgi:23S rRNA (pseudouridine1915-N3)-methyltransferase|nr:23S rRNA (pseudouridine(1915)-N(3))-methyltransferase RlmH [Planctomycetota bacterium]
MTNIIILAVGRLKAPYYRAAADEYLKRLKPYAKISVEELPSAPFTEKTKKLAQATEGESISRWLDARREGRVFILDEHGDRLDSPAFSRLVSAATAPSYFVIGGALGLDKAILVRAHQMISLSRLTLPHELARVVLLEQIYRAVMIDKGKTYHY